MLPPPPLSHKEPTLPDDTAHLVHVFEAADLFVSSGANAGDDLTDGEALCAGDIYELDSQARLRPLALERPQPGEPHRVARGSAIGAAGDAVAVCGRLVLMAPDAQKAELLILRLDRRGAGRGSGAAPLWVLPLSPLMARTEYMLLTAEAAPDDLQLADLICLSLHRGSRVMLASGGQVPVEQLRPGMRVRTRDRGAQELRWIGKSTLRARGAFAPVVVPAGLMGNEGELVVGPHQRLFLYNRARLPGQHCSELLVQARHLVDDSRIYRREGGYAEYFSLVFDHHEVIYAEGLPVESLRVHRDLLGALPAPLREEVQRDLPGLDHAPHHGQEAHGALIPALHHRLHGIYGSRARSNRRSA